MNLMELGQQDTVEIQLDRHDEPREVRVKKVFLDSEEVRVEYPNTTGDMLGGMATDLQERVDVENVVGFDG